MQANRPWTDWMCCELKSAGRRLYVVCSLYIVCCRALTGPRDVRLVSYIRGGAFCSRHCTSDGESHQGVGATA